jgi:hypothetical protein
MATRIVVIVKDGLVRDVLCSEQDVEVDVVDLDTQDEAVADELRGSAAKYAAEVKAGTLHEVA